MTIAEQILPQFIIKICEFLAIPLTNNSLIFLSVWSIIHFIFGAVIFYLIRKEKYPLLVLFELLILYEFFEFMISYIIPLILMETFLDTFFDLAVGMMAGLIAYIFLKIND